MHAESVLDSREDFRCRSWARALGILYLRLRKHTTLGPTLQAHATEPTQMQMNKYGRGYNGRT
jgi:hypothetical protein